MTQRQKIRMYSHHDRDIDEFDEDFWPVMGVLITIIAIWTAVIHFIDYMTLNVIPWWVEPFTIAPVILLIVMKERFDSLNPLHWWPVFWGYRVKIPDDDRITIRPLDSERILKQHGGMLNFHIVDYDTLKFRKRKDAVIFTLLNS